MDRHMGYSSCLGLNGQCHKIFGSGFFMKQLLLVPIGRTRNYLDLFQIFLELCIFVIDSLVVNKLRN
jgi:hypothetical protein